MQLENIPEFSGTQEDKNQPSDFLKAIKRSFLANGTTTDDQKVNLFELYLKSDSPAEEWYNDANTPKKAWLDLEKEFKVRFPNVKKATKTAPELERELGAMKIKTEELGKTEKYKGEDVYTHMIFAEKILDLAKRAKVEGSTSGLWKVRDELPEILREKIPENQTSWVAFAQAIKDVEMGHVREGVRKFKEKTASEAQIKADINYLMKQRTANAAAGDMNSPTKAIRTQFASATISQPPAHRPVQGDTFSGAGGGGGNLFNTTPRAPRPPATEEEKAILKASLARYPMQPDTQEGDAAYLDQLRAWRQANGDNQVSKSTGFPLRPGGAQPASRECYNCGRAGHRRSDCNTTGNKKLAPLESTFRSICGSILGQPSRRTAQINYIAASGNDEFAWLNLESTGQQGNGEGPSAL
jgi:Zinc knuckle